MNERAKGLVLQLELGFCESQPPLVVAGLMMTAKKGPGHHLRVSKHLLPHQ